MKLWYMHGNELRKIENIVDVKHGQMYYHVTHGRPGYTGQQVKTKVFTRFIVAIEEF